MGWTREGDIARNFFLHFFLRVNWVRGRKFLSSQGSGFHLPYFLFSSIRWFLGFWVCFSPRGFLPWGCPFFLARASSHLGRNPFRRWRFWFLRSHNSWYSYYLRESWVFSLDTFQMSFDGLGIRRSCCFFPCSSIVLQGFFPWKFHHGNGVFLLAQFPGEGLGAEGPFWLRDLIPAEVSSVIFFCQQKNGKFYPMNFGLSGLASVWFPLPYFGDPFSWILFLIFRFCRRGFWTFLTFSDNADSQGIQAYFCSS